MKKTVVLIKRFDSDLGLQSESKRLNKTIVFFIYGP